MASARIQRWALTLGAYNYKIEYRPGQQMAHANALRRLLLPVFPKSVPLPGDLVLLMTHLSGTTPVTAVRIEEMTGKDPLLAQVQQFIEFGWTETCHRPDLRPYFNRREELSTWNGCVIWGSRVVVPPRCREAHNCMRHIRE